MTNLNDVGRYSTEWRKRRDLSTDPAWVMAKLTEEVGEMARALVGHYEDRPGRGSLMQEAAQTIIVICSLINIMFPDMDLDEQVDYELGALPRA